MSERNVPLDTMVEAHIEKTLEDTHTMLTAVVVSYDPTTNSVGVKATQLHAYYDESGTRQLEDLAIVNRVPVEFMSAGGFSLVCPISTGSNGLGPATTGKLCFSEAALDQWKSSNGLTPLDPGFDRRMDPTDAVFVPGLRTLVNPIPNIPLDHATLGADVGVRLHFTKSYVLAAVAGAQGQPQGSADFVAMAQKVLTELNAIGTAFSAHTHVIPPLTGTIDVPAGTCSIPASATEAAATYSPNSVAATSLKST